MVEKPIKRLLKMIIVLLFFFSISIQARAEAVDLYLNGSKIEITGQGAILKNSRLFLPASFMEDRLGIDIKWAPDRNRLNITIPDTNDKAPFKPVYYKDRVVVLMYHDIREQNETTPAALALHEFEEQMKLLHDSGFQVISMDQYADYMLSGKTVPNNAVLITFDDGYETFYTYAYPILKKYNFSATNFVIVSSVDKQYGIKKMSWEQMREMQADGMSFYSHTYDSHKYVQTNKSGSQKKPALFSPLYNKAFNRVETNKEYVQRVRNDLALAEQRLREELGNDRGVIAFPYGSYNNQVIEIAESVGIELSFSVKRGINSREDRVGYRVNGAAVNMAPRELIGQIMRKGAPYKDGASEQLRVMINGQEIIFQTALPERAGNDGKEVLLPLKEICDIIGVKVSWDAKSKTVELTDKREVPL